ncbi:hypothetical protein ACFWHQ_23135 [Streptomyces sp. NPDC060334]|uniref:hypothetical protein n=1 Tax=unclassified Streptomyces TaxID=2593676 RepID=UPI00225B4EC9|nr:hypothetical protein [Streptomyces sp. NBC_00424]MCX5071413.1 hypothetical protein [Streptomyces sp. NBC_00424]WUD45178.1 hypothetical protein OHA84_34270 [Streptomyces sp. NBC_00513]
MKDPKSIALGVRERAIRGDDAVDIALWVKAELGNETTFFAFVSCFFHGLGVPVHAIRELEGWNGVGGDRDVSDADVRASLDPYLVPLRQQR